MIFNYTVAFSVRVFHFNIDASQASEWVRVPRIPSADENGSLLVDDRIDHSDAESHRRHKIHQPKITRNLQLALKFSMFCLDQIRRYFPTFPKYRRFLRGKFVSISFDRIIVQNTECTVFNVLKSKALPTAPRNVVNRFKLRLRQ